jgi:hypothetical protein
MRGHDLLYIGLPVDSLAKLKFWIYRRDAD